MTEPDVYSDLATTQRDLRAALAELARLRGELEGKRALMAKGAEALESIAHDHEVATLAVDIGEVMLAELREQNAALAAKLADAEATVAKLRQYTRHEPRCNSLVSSRWPCTCGLDALLAPRAGQAGAE